VLLHGLGANADSWQLQLPALTEAGYRPIALDLRGFGASTYPGGVLRIPEMAGDVILLLHALGIENVDLVGISMGGVVGLQLALDHPTYVHKLVLVNAFASLEPDNFSQFVYYYFRLVMVHTLGVEAQAKAVAHRIFPNPKHEDFREQLRAQILQADPRAYRGVMRALRVFNVKDRLGEIQIPTLVVTAKNDTTVSPQRQTVLAKHIPNAQQVFISDANHAVTIDQPHHFNQNLIEFLQPAN